MLVAFFLDNPLFLKKLANAIRGALIAKGLTENTAAPDVRVDFTVTGEEFGDTQRSLVRGIGGGPVAIRRPIRIAEGMLDDAKQLVGTYPKLIR
jgi:hypothetical protein